MVDLSHAAGWALYGRGGNLAGRGVNGTSGYLAAQEILHPHELRSQVIRGSGPEVRQPPQRPGLFISGGGRDYSKDRYRDGLGLLDSVEGGPAIAIASPIHRNESKKSNV